MSICKHGIQMLTRKQIRKMTLRIEELRQTNDPTYGKQVTDLQKRLRPCPLCAREENAGVR